MINYHLHLNYLKAYGISLPAFTSPYQVAIWEGVENLLTELGPHPLPSLWTEINFIFTASSKKLPVYRNTLFLGQFFICTDFGFAD